MSYTVLYYETADGKCQVADFLKKLGKSSPRARNKCLSYVGLLAERGPSLTANYAKKIRGKIWELRPEFGGTEYRILYARVSQAEFLLILALHHDQWEISEQDIARCERHLTDFEQRRIG